MHRGASQAIHQSHLSPTRAVHHSLLLQSLHSRRHGHCASRNGGLGGRLCSMARQCACNSCRCCGRGHRPLLTLEQGRLPLDVQEGLLLPGKAGVGEVFGGGTGAHGDGWQRTVWG